MCRDTLRGCIVIGYGCLSSPALMTNENNLDRYIVLFKSSQVFNSGKRNTGLSDRQTGLPSTTSPAWIHIAIQIDEMTPFVKNKHDFGPVGFRWISTKRIEWVGGDGRTRFWESVERTTRPQEDGQGNSCERYDADAVALVAKTRGDDSQILLIKQFRPPLGKYCLEMPAGLIDPGETPEAAALRELKEETGYTAHIVSMSPVVFNDPGITNANMMLCICDIDLDLDVNKDVKQDCHDGEDIETLWAPHQGLLEFLLQKRDESTEIDARLLMYAMGYHQINLVYGSRDDVREAEEKKHRGQTHGTLLRHSAATLQFREVVAWAVTGIAVLVSLMRR